MGWVKCSELYSTEFHCLICHNIIYENDNNTCNIVSTTKDNPVSDVTVFKLRNARITRSIRRSLVLLKKASHDPN